MRKFVETSKTCALAFGLISITIAHAAPITPPDNFEFENWGTQFSPENPLHCDKGAGCSSATTQLNIEPTTKSPALPVDRTVQLKALDPMGVLGASGGAHQAVAETTPAGPGCSNSMGDGCLKFATGDYTFASMTLDYHFNAPDGVYLKKPVGILINNSSTKTDFHVSAFYFDSTQDKFIFADDYLVKHGDNKTFRFDFPTNTATTDVALIYNPITQTGTISTATLGIKTYDLSGNFHDGVASIESELCCVQAANVPEPETYTLMLAGLLAVGVTLRKRSLV